MADRSNSERGDDSERDDSDSDNSDETNDAETSHRVDPHAPMPKPQYAFLNDWFLWVEGRCAVSDAERNDSHTVRIGREMDDLWIDVYLENAVDASDRWHDVRARRTREGLLLLAALARVDYASWLGGMARKAQFTIPPYLALEHCPELPRRYCFCLSSLADTRCFLWIMLKNSVGDDDFTPAFGQAMAQLQEVARTEGRDKNMLDAIPIKLSIEPGQKDINHELAILYGVTETVRELLAINDRNMAMEATEAACTRPWFRLESIDLNLRAFTQRPDVFDALRELLETGIHVNTLTLPSRKPRNFMDIDEAPTSVAWTELILVALGHRVLASGDCVQIDRLDIDGVYMSEQFMIPLCSLLRDTRSVKHVTFLFDMFHELVGASQRRIWAWLCYALFSPTRSNSITTLELASLKLCGTSLGVVTPGELSMDPVGDLWKAATKYREPPATSAIARPTVRIVSGSTITIRGVEAQAPQLTTASAHTGILVHDKTELSTVDVLVPGLGFCEVSREQIVPCDEAIERNATADAIETLVVKMNYSPWHDGRGPVHVATMRSLLEGLLQFTGSSLTALALECELLDRTALHLISRLCPNLDSLRLRGLTDDSTDTLTRLYEAPTNCRITSLDLSDFHVPIDAFAHFLNVLTPDEQRHPIQKLLQRLRVGQGTSSTFNGDISRAVTRMFRSNINLSHFMMYEVTRNGRRPRALRLLGFNDDDDSDDEVIAPEDEAWKLSNRALLPQPFTMTRKLAFLSVVRGFGLQSHAGGQLGSDLIQQIFSFAADRVWRRAFTLRDVDSALHRYIRRRAGVNRL